MIKYWIKLLTSSEQSLLFKTYKMLINDIENNLNYNKSNWAYHIKVILEECGLYYIWQNQFNMLINFDMIQQRIKDIYYQQWYSEINNSRRLETYGLFKHTFEFETYLDFIHERKFRIALTRFRTSSHDLAIERGRYLNLPREERICNNCNSGLIESEFHFVLTCSKLTELRSKFIKRYYYSWPTLQKLSNLLSLKSKNAIRDLSKYIYYANLRRK